jgi:hypothetical protein
MGLWQKKPSAVTSKEPSSLMVTPSEQKPALSRAEGPRGLLKRHLIRFLDSAEPALSRAEGAPLGMTVLVPIHSILGLVRCS